MKTLVAGLTLIASTSFAAQVTVDGFGNTCDAALQNAKQLAVEKVTGTFIAGKSSTDGNTYSEDIVQYNGGVITSYQVKETVTKDGCYVNLTANVEEKKDNRVVLNSSEFSTDYKEYNKRKKVVNALDNPSSAMYATASNVRVVHKDGYVVVDADITLGLQPKWISDVKSFSTLLNEEGNVSNDLYSRAHASVVGSVMERSMPAAVVLAIIGEESPPQTNENMMVCFDGRDCMNIGADFGRMQMVPKLSIVGNNKVVYERLLFDNKLFEFIPAGSSKKYAVITRKYNQPAFIINTRNTQKMHVSFKVDDSVAREIKKLEIYIQ